MSKGHSLEALRLIDTVAERLADNREILLMKATTLEFARRTDDAGGLLEQLHHRWPEWSALWAAHGIILAAHEHYPQAVQSLEAAITLGARHPETYFFLAKAYDAVGRKQEAQTAREQSHASANGVGDAFYLSRLFEGSLVLPRTGGAWR